MMRVSLAAVLVTAAMSLGQCPGGVCPGGVCPTPSFRPSFALPQYTPTAGAYRPHWTHPPDLDGHLTGTHGQSAAAIAGMSFAEKERLHDQLHDAASGRSVGLSVPATAVAGLPFAQTVRTTATSSVTAVRSQGFVQPQSRSGLFPNFQPFGGRFRR